MMKTLFGDFSKGHLLVLATLHRHNLKTSGPIFIIFASFLSAINAVYYAVQIAKSQKVSMQLISGGRVTYTLLMIGELWDKTKFE